MIRRARSSIALALLAALIRTAIADVDCSGNVVISSPDDARDARNACSIIGGDVSLSGDIADDINLDGVESIVGSLTYQGCATGREDCDAATAPFRVSSSTLTTINGTIDFWYPHGLEELLLPHLTCVGTLISIKRAPNLTRVDLTDLTDIGSIVLDTNRLERLDLNGLEAFTSQFGSVSIWNGGRVKSFDGLFKNPMRTPEGSTRHDISIANIPNVRRLQIGWSDANLTQVTGDDLEVIFGAPGGGSMHMDKAIFRGNVTLSREPNLENITIDDTTFFNVGVQRLPVPLDQTSRVTVDSGNYNFTTIVLPPAAEDWFNTSFSAMAPALELREYDDDGSQIWYWPKTMNSISLSGAIENDFFDSFLDRGSSITKSALITDRSGSFDCDKFEKKAGSSIPRSFTCHTTPRRSDDDDDDDSAATIVTQQLFWTQVFVTVTVVFIVVI